MVRGIYFMRDLEERLGFKDDDVEWIGLGETRFEVRLRNGEHKGYFYSQLITQDGQIEANLH